MDYEERTYHGVWADDDDARIFVETTERGPTERQLHMKVLRELDGGYGMGWGHNGHSTSRAASAVLADAFGLDPDRDGIGTTSYPQDPILVRLREDFCVDVLTQAQPEWRLRHGAVLRWALGWYVQHGIAPHPALQNLPPVG